jgi:hypothetical protein
MAYQQFTKCCSPGDYVPPLSPRALSLLAVLVATTFAAVAAALASAATPAVIILLGLAVAADLAAIAACNVYLYQRLICLQPQQQCAIGMVIDVTPPSPGQVKTYFGDNDFTMDIFLAPGPMNFSDLSLSQQPPQGFLITEQNLILGVGLGYADPATENRSRFGLHCEFEGSGVADLLMFASAILVFLLAILALLLLEAVVPALAPILTLLEILAGVFAGIGLLAPHLPSSEGSPLDVGLGQLSPGDIVVVTGDWVYDGGHGGWNEIHAVHSCQIILDHTRVPKDAKGNLAWPTGTDQELGVALSTVPEVSQAIDVFCKAIGNATVTETGGSRTDPANNWIIHPLVDGCKKTPVIV